MNGQVKKLQQERHGNLNSKKDQTKLRFDRMDLQKGIGTIE